MKFQCEACERLVPLEVFRVEAGVLVVKCDRCGAESRARASASASVAVGSAALSREGAAPSSSASLPEAARETAREVASAAPQLPLPQRASSPALRVVRGATPGTAPSGEALFEPPPGYCPKCVAVRREGAESCAQCGLVYVNFVPDEHYPSSVLAEAWRALAARWDDWEAHDRLMTLAMGRGELAMLGRLYRLWLARAPEDAMAQRGRDEVVRRATLVVPSSSSSSSDAVSASATTQKRMKTLGVAVLFLVSVVLAVFLFQNLRSLLAGP
ncbi:hypothetical protein [Pyxidicoccus trucidator]|uniref:hypothetical protein n=1 Tax=Pyxidicoccus trucidator TaxID=2709662 RepID=UPI0013DD8079|nr:hypothetical protein [Pyxidicoccus trucidator]